MGREYLIKENASNESKRRQRGNLKKSYFFKHCLIFNLFYKVILVIIFVNKF